jgi:hypothetical protein
MARPDCCFRDPRIDCRDRHLSERMAKKDFRWFLFFLILGFVFNIIGALVISNI